MKIELTTVDDTVAFGRQLAGLLRPGDLSSSTARLAPERRRWYGVSAPASACPVR